MPRPQDLAGKRFGRLLAQAITSQYGRRAWLCLCDCGSATVATTSHLRSGAIQSCGCLRNEKSTDRIIKCNTTHGGRNTRAYWVWRTMRARCENKRSPHYPGYGGRGIRVCDRWSSFEVFRADMGDPPKGLSIERIDNDGNYEPDNCRWASSKEQANNRRDNRWLQYGSETKTLTAWALHFGVTKTTLWRHLQTKSMAEVGAFYESRNLPTLLDGQAG